MIISHKYKFIFLKTNKTASTSIEIALSKFCGEEDIITPISPPDEETRRKLGYRGAQNYLVPLRRYDFIELARYIARKKTIHFYGHMQARLIKKYIGNRVWESYYKFCFERNPWDRFISIYYWRCQSEPRPTISEFLESDEMAMLKKRGFEVYTIEGKPVVDRVCYFENLSEELEKIRIKLGIPESLELPNAKSGSRKDRRNYRDILTEEQKIKIEQFFSDEIRLFGYTY